MRKKFNSFVRTICRVIPDKVYLSLKYRVRMGKWINWKNPKTFNEKLQWLKLYDRKSQYTKMVDKYESKKYVAGIIGEKHIIPTYGVWDSFDEIDFNGLPAQFVLKCTHDSGGLVVCHDKSKLNFKDVHRKIDQSMKENYFYSGREWPYKNVKPRIIAEKYMEDDSKGLMDYKFYCFNGIPRYLYVSKGLDNHETAVITFLTLDWECAPFRRSDYHEFDTIPKKPSQFEEMKELAQILSVNIPFCRIDFYEVDNKVYFGEITFYPTSGFTGFVPKEWDYNLGKLIELGL